LSAPVKRVIDVAGAGAGLIVLSPVLGAVAVAVRLRHGRPVIYRSTRAGQHEQPFSLLKFRTMTDARGPDGVPLPDAERLTPLGVWLRSYSLDELPQLWNVVRGDMSLVGPRPLPVAYLRRYRPEERRRHHVRPGITGWAQVKGRNSVDWDERLALDAWYAEHRSLRLDLAILARTFGIVLRREGITGADHATMPDLPVDHALGKR
jgi:sugar transferase EpsL